MNDKVQGLILEVKEYKENDLLASTLTKDYGIITLVCKGSQKMSSHHHYMPFSFYEFIIDYKDNKDIYVPRSAKLLKNYYDDKNISLIAYKNVLTQSYLRNKELMNDETYNNLLFVLDNMKEENKYLLGCLLFSDLLRRSGLSPEVDGCVRCGKDKVIGISSIDGGFLCKDHAKENDIFSPSTLKKFRLINKARFKDYELIKDNEFELLDFKIIVEFFINNAGINLPAYDFYISL